VQLLVSVADGREAAAALLGGAEIVDAKDPTRGALGPVSVATLRDLRLVVPPGIPLSAALGDFDNAEAASRAVLAVRDLGLSFVKIGFLGVPNVGVIADVIAGSIAAAGSTSVVAVAYADADRTGSLPAEMIGSIAVGAGARGVLLDTALKDAGRLPQLWDATRLAEWISGLRARGVIAAVGGSLDARDFAWLARSAPDVVGVRGAACEGGRTGTVVAGRVRDLKCALDAVAGYAGPSPVSQSPQDSSVAAVTHLQPVPAGSALGK
jgi:uncharacterized protein (UPF0264 family)